MSEKEKKSTEEKDIKVDTKENKKSDSKEKSSEKTSKSDDTTKAQDKPRKKSNMVKYLTAGVIALLIVLAVLYKMESEGRSSTTIFSSLIASQEANKTVAVVNGNKINNAALTASITQFSQVAATQGVDITNPEAISEIKNQALEVLINTELLKQAAAEKGLEVTDEAAAERLNLIETDLGGPEVLTERMQVLGISRDQLHKDIKDELLIQQLLDQMFAEAEITVSEEEINAVYADASGAEPNLPALEEVRAQVEAQIKSSKEQIAIDEYLSSLKTEAEIEVVE